MNTPTKGNLYFFLIIISLFIGSIFVSLSIDNKVYSTLILEFGFIFIPTVILLLIRGNIKENIMLRSLKIKDLFLVILVGAISITIVLCINVATAHLFHNFVSDSVSSLPKLSLLQIMLVIAVTPTICEELFFRGFLLSQYRNISIHKAALMNGLFFGIFHMNINQFLYTFCLGVIMVYVVAITKSILASMIMHFMLNGLTAFSLWSSSSKAAEAAGPTAEYSTGYLGVGILMIVLLAILVHILRWWASSKNLSFSQPVNMEKALEDEDFRAEFNNSDETQIIDVWFILSVGFFILNILLLYASTGSI